MAEMVSKSQKHFPGMRDDISGSQSNVGWHNTGSLAVARSSDTWRMLRSMAHLGGYLGNEHKLVSAADINKIHPFLNTDGIHGGILSTESDGIINPADVTLHISRLFLPFCLLLLFARTL